MRDGSLRCCAVLCCAVLGVALGILQPAILAGLHGAALALRATLLHASMAIMPLLPGVFGSALGAASLFWTMALATGSVLAGRSGLASPGATRSAGIGS